MNSKTAAIKQAFSPGECSALLVGIAALLTRMQKSNEYVDTFGTDKIAYGYSALNKLLFLFPKKAQDELIEQMKLEGLKIDFEPCECEHCKGEVH